MHLVILTHLSLFWIVYVEVQKVTAPKPKEISTRGHRKREEMVSPKGLKPKNIKKKKRASPKIYEKRRKKKKRSPDQKIEEES